MTEQVKQRRKYHTKNEGVDFEKEISEHKRCPQCKRATVAETDYINVKTGKPTKLCIMCRTSVTASIKRHGVPTPKKRTPKMSMVNRIILYEKIISLMAPDSLGKILEENELVLPRDFMKIEQIDEQDKE